MLTKLSTLKKSIHVEFEKTLSDESNWKPSVSRIRSRPDNLIIMSRQSTTETYDRIEFSDTGPPAMFLKIVKKFDAVSDQIGNTITEGNEDEEDDEVVQEGEVLKEGPPSVKLKNSMILSTEPDDYSSYSFEEFSNN